MAEGGQRHPNCLDMKRRITYEEALNRIAERTSDNVRELRKTRLQRRTEFTDLYGVPFYAQGDGTNPATFYISISPDLVYFLRFQFKLHIQPLISTVTGSGGGAVNVDSTSLSVDSTTKVMDDSSVAQISVSDVSPNPHSHNASGGGGSANYGIHKVHTTSDDFKISINGVDITDYLIAQHEGEWIDGEGLYPNKGNTDSEDFYDVMAVATDIYNENDSEESITNVNKLLNATFKKVEIESDAPFAVTMYLYCKYSVVGR